MNVSRYFASTDLGERYLENLFPSVMGLQGKREVIKLVEGINFSNGIMLSPDRKRFYCNDTFVGTWAFDVADDLTLGNRQMLIEKVDADGMARIQQSNAVSVTWKRRTCQLLILSRS
jgi:sugar lactone lactonase YvrE